MVRHPGHGHRVGALFVTAGEGDAENARGGDGVVQENLVKSPMRMNSKAVGMLCFGRQVLAHHRRIEGVTLLGHGA